MVVLVSIDKIIQTIERLYQIEVFVLLELDRTQFEYLWDPSQDQQGEDLDPAAIASF